MPFSFSSRDTWPYVEGSSAAVLKHATAPTLPASRPAMKRLISSDAPAAYTELPRNKTSAFSVRG